MYIIWIILELKKNLVFCACEILKIIRENGVNNFFTSAE
jgi:hypothetical protein